MWPETVAIIAAILTVGTDAELAEWENAIVEYYTQIEENCA